MRSTQFINSTNRVIQAFLYGMEAELLGSVVLVTQIKNIKEKRKEDEKEAK